MDSKEIQTERLYGDLAYLWPLLSPPEDYEEEAMHWRSILFEKLGKEKKEILELGVGGGHNLSHLTSDVDATAVDLSEAMLERCRNLNPGVILHRGDMRNIRLGKEFSAVLIHDAVNHLLTGEDLAATFQTVALHLQKNGIVILSPDWFTESFHAPIIENVTHSNADMELTYFSYTHDPNPNDTNVEEIIIYCITANGRLRIEHDKFILGLFPKSTWIRLLEKAGFSVEIRPINLKSMEKPHELLVGTLL